MPKVNREEVLSPTLLPPATKGSSGLRVRLRGKREEQKINRSERAIVHLISKAGFGSPCSHRNFGEAGSRGFFQPSSMAIVLEAASA